jgi:hypothetical protein
MALETTSRKDCLLVRDGSLLAVVLPTTCEPAIFALTVHTV